VADACAFTVAQRPSPALCERPSSRPIPGSIWLGLIVGILLLASYASAQNASNPKQVALQRWYPMNSVAQISPCTGSYPYWVAANPVFDGAHMWVPCLYDNYGDPDVQAAEIQEFNASDGALLRTIPITIPTGTMELSNLLFDGENIWMAVSVFQATSPLIKIQASTGTIVNTFTLPDYAGPGLAFDGTNVWVTIQSNPDSVSKVLASTGAVTTYQLFNCVAPTGMAFDGSHIWISCWSGYTVQELNSSGGEITAVAVGDFPSGLAFDGTNIWVANSGVYSVSRINVTTLAMTPFLWGGCFASQLVYDSHYIWVSGSSTQGDDCGTGSTGNSVSVTSKLDVSTGAIVASYPNIGGVLGFDGGNLWGTSVNGAIKKF
jgi:hypothetical protein